MKTLAVSENPRTSTAAVGHASFLVPRRDDQPELLDQEAGTLDDVRSNLAEMWRINRLLGGVHALSQYLEPLLRASSSPLRVADLGTGSGELGLLLSQRAARQRQSLTVYGLDYSARNLSVARGAVRSEVRFVQADACALPFRAGSIDLFISSLLLHHLTPEQVVHLLRMTFQRARRGIVMNDIVRGYLPLAAFRLIQPLFARHYLTRHDGEVSIRRAYTPDELRALAREAGLETARVITHFPWRMTLIAEKSGV